MRRKIVFVLPALTTGGAERAIITLMNKIDRSEYAPEFITLNSTGNAGKWISGDVPQHTLGHKGILAGLPGLLRLLREIKPDVIVTTLVYMNFGLILLKPWLGKTPIIIREANLPSAMERGTRFPAWVRAAYRWVMIHAYRFFYPKADLAIAPAQCMVDEFDSYLGINATNYGLLYNPVDLNRTRGITEIAPRDPNVVSFVCVGRLHRAKGFDRLFETLADFKPNRPWHLTIYGEGSERPRLEALLEEKGLKEKVTLYGTVDNPSRFVAAADCLLLPSRYEGMPNVVLEALSVGTRAVAMREAGGIVEIANLAQPGDVILCDTIKQLVEQMSKITPQPTTYLRPSRLPDAFQETNIIERFESFLDHLTPKKTPAKQQAERRELEAVD